MLLFHSWITTIVGAPFAVIVAPLSALAIVISLVLAVLSLANNRRRLGKSDGYYSLMFARSYLSQLLSAACCVFALFDCAARVFGTIGVLGLLPSGLDIACYFITGAISLVASMFVFGAFGLITGLHFGMAFNIRACARHMHFPDFPTVSFRQSFTGMDYRFMLGFGLTFVQLPLLMRFYQFAAWMGFPFGSGLVLMSLLSLIGSAALTIIITCVSFYIKATAMRALDEAAGRRISVRDSVAVSKYLKWSGLIPFALSFTVPAFASVCIVITVTEMFIVAWDSTTVTDCMSVLVLASVCLHTVQTGIQLGKFPMKPRQLMQPKPMVSGAAIVVREEPPEEEEAITIQQTQVLIRQT